MIPPVVSFNLNQSQKKPINIIVDNCFYSRTGLIELFKKSGSPCDNICFSNINEFIHWRECNNERIASLLICFHDRTAAIPEEIAHFLIKSTDALKVNRSDIVLISDAISSLRNICIFKLKVHNLLNNRDKMDVLSLQLKQFVNFGIIDSVTVKSGIKQYSTKSSRNPGALSPGEMFAITNLLTGVGIKHSSRLYSGHYKTLYNQRISAIKKLGMRNIHDIIKYRHLIGETYLKDYCIVSSGYHESLC